MTEIEKLFEHIKDHRMFDTSAVEEDGDSQYYYEIDADVLDPALTEIKRLQDIIGAVERLDSDVLDEAIASLQCERTAMYL